MKSKVFILTALCALQQACERHQQAIQLTNKECNSSIHTLCINERERFVLTGKLDRLTISHEINVSNQWKEQCSCLVERLTDRDNAQATEHEAVQEGNICTQTSEVGNVGYHAATFYHPATGLLIHQMRCDHPGLLNARASLAGGKVTNRAEMQTSVEHINAGILFIPFESEVTPEDNSLVIRGEGELVFVMSIEETGNQETGVAAKWRQACMKYDAGNDEHYDVIKVTNAMRSEREIRSRNP